jgi:hypothetical protein
MTPFRIELERRSTTYFSWWQPPEPLLEHARRDDAAPTGTAPSA